MEKDDNPMMDDGTVDDESIDDSTMDSDDDSDSDDSGDRDDSHERFISDITRDLFDNVKNGFYFHTNSFILCQPETKAAFRAAVRQNHTNRSLCFIADDAGEIWEEWEDDTRNELLQELGSLESLQELYFNGNVNVNDRCQLVRYATKIQKLCISIYAADSFDDVQRVMTSIGALKSLLNITVVFSPSRQQQAQIAWVVDSLSQMDNLSSIKLFPANYDSTLEISPQALIGLVRLTRGLTKLEVWKVRFQKQWVKTIADTFTEKKKTPLKYLDILFDHPAEGHDDEYPKTADWNQLLEALRQNYDLEHVIFYSMLADDAQKKADIICELNRAGRCYLLSADSTSAREKGIEVLSKVAHDLDCILTHLLENPVLCHMS